MDNKCARHRWDEERLLEVYRSCTIPIAAASSGGFQRSDATNAPCHKPTSVQPSKSKRHDSENTRKYETRVKTSVAFWSHEERGAAFGDGTQPSHRLRHEAVHVAILLTLNTTPTLLSLKTTGGSTLQSALFVCKSDHDE